jgi:hypothetical protein
VQRPSTIGTSAFCRAVNEDRNDVLFDAPKSPTSRAAGSKVFVNRHPTG